MVSIWSLNFTVHNMPETKVLAKGKNEIKFDEIKVNDIIDVNGLLASDQQAFIHADIIHDRSQVTAGHNDKEIGRLREQLREIMERLNKLLNKKGDASPLASPQANTGTTTSQ
jgi:hypothetical protein